MSAVALSLGAACLVMLSSDQNRRRRFLLAAGALWVFEEAIAVLGVVKFGRRPSTVRLSTSALNDGAFNRLEYSTASFSSASVDYHPAYPAPPSRSCSPYAPQRVPASSDASLTSNSRLGAVVSPHRRRFCPTAVGFVPPPSAFRHLTDDAPFPSRFDKIAQQHHLSSCAPRALLDFLALRMIPHLTPPASASPPAIHFVPSPPRAPLLSPARTAGSAPAAVASAKFLSVYDTPNTAPTFRRTTPSSTVILVAALATLDAAIINFNSVIASTAAAVAFPTIVVAFTTAVVAFTTAVVAFTTIVVAFTTAVVAFTAVVTALTTVASPAHPNKTISHSPPSSPLSPLSSSLPPPSSTAVVVASTGTAAAFSLIAATHHALTVSFTRPSASGLQPPSTLETPLPSFPINDNGGGADVGYGGNLTGTGRKRHT
ncbi:hypothetical protein R3P38DRAFT_3214195 [Favolaschia claudopus]|uniref:Uncharacterized protein n=1 Tax=Favolaschia claudopus TaxID=2862362 RepID=A0AAW0AAC2_9AGAR